MFLFGFEADDIGFGLRDYGASVEQSSVEIAAVLFEERGANVFRGLRG